MALDRRSIWTRYLRKSVAVRNSTWNRKRVLLKVLKAFREAGEDGRTSFCSRATVTICSLVMMMPMGMASNLKFPSTLGTLITTRRQPSSASMRDASSGSRAAARKSVGHFTARLTPSISSLVGAVMLIQLPVSRVSRVKGTFIFSGKVFRTDIMEAFPPSQHSPLPD